MSPTTSLTAATEEFRDGLRAKIGSVLDDLDNSPEEFGARTYATPQVGEVAPEFALPSTQGGTVSLAELRGRGRVVLVFFRGNWCPYDDIQLRSFSAALDEIKAAGAEVVAVSPQTPETSLGQAEKTGIKVPLLSDAGSAVADSYGLRVTLEGRDREVHAGVGVDLPALSGDESWALPIPSVFIIESDGTISYASIAGDFRWRVGSEEILEALAA